MNRQLGANSEKKVGHDGGRRRVLMDDSSLITSEGVMPMKAKFDMSDGEILNMIGRLDLENDLHEPLYKKPDDIRDIVPDKSKLL